MVSMIIPGKNDAEKHAWLGRNRLWPVADLLLERGLISPALAAAAQTAARSHERSMAAQLDEERRVVSALSDAGAKVLVLKGALLAQTVYPRPESRFRGDLDLLTDPAQLSKVEHVLRELGYRRPMEVQSPMPMRQSLWARSEGRQTFSVDLHWDLRNHPALRARLEFQTLLQQAEALPGLGEGAMGMGRAHALINASMHYFNDYADERPCQWLLDKDLLWRAMAPDERAQSMQIAREHGLAGLLAESMARTRHLFDTPVTDSEIESLSAAGAGQWPTGLVRANEARWSAYWFALRSEPGLRRKLVRIRRGLVPPAGYMRQLYPDGSRFGLFGLYLRRLGASLNAQSE
jgi:hypothetical protein